MGRWILAVVLVVLAAQAAARETTMSWIQLPHGMWTNTAGDPYDPSNYMTDEQFQSAFQQSNPNPLWLQNNLGVSESGMIVEDPSWQPAESSMHFVSSTQPTTGQTIDAGEYGTFSSPFWQNRYDPATTHWSQVIKDLGQGGMPSLAVMQELAGSGFLNRFPSFANDPAAQEWLGVTLAQMQDYEDSSQAQADMGVMSIMAAPALAGAGMAAAGATGSAIAGGAAAGGLAGLGNAAIQGENLGEGTLKGAAIGGATGAAAQTLGSYLPTDAATSGAGGDGFFDGWAPSAPAAPAAVDPAMIAEAPSIADQYQQFQVAQAPGATMTDVSPGLMEPVQVSQAGGELFGPGAAETLDASLIGPQSGALPGSGSAFAPSAAAAGMFEPGAAETLDRSLIGPDAGALPGSGSAFAPSLPATQSLEAPEQEQPKPQSQEEPTIAERFSQSVSEAPAHPSAVDLTAEQPTLQDAGMDLGGFDALTAEQLAFTPEEMMLASAEQPLEEPLPEPEPDPIPQAVGEGGVPQTSGVEQPPSGPGTGMPSMSDLSNALQAAAAGAVLVGALDGNDTPADTTAEDLRRQEEARQLTLRNASDDVNRLFGRFDDTYFSGISDAYRNFAMPQYQEQVANARRRLPMSVPHTQSSAYNRKASELERDILRGESDIGSEAINQATRRRGEVDQTKSELLALASSGADAESVASQAAARAERLSAPPEFSPIADMFGKYSNDLLNMRFLNRPASAAPVQRPLTFSHSPARSVRNVA